MDISAAAPPRRSLTEAAFRAEAIARFGPDPTVWAFECPGCGDVATAADFPAGLGERAGAECVGRHVTGRGCPRTAFGLIPGPWLLMLADGSVVGSFPLADALSGPLRAAREIAGTGAPERAENPPAPVLAPACALSVERRDPGPRPPWPDFPGLRLLTVENWDYRVALTGQQSVCGYVDADPDVPLILTFIDTAGGPLDWCHYLRDGVDSTLEHIIDHGLPITRQDVETAVALVREAYGEDHPAAAAAPEPHPYWTAEEGWTDSIGCSCHISAPCSRCEQLRECELCEDAASVPECDMDAHQAEVHGESGAAAESEA